MRIKFFYCYYQATKEYVNKLLNILFSMILRKKTGMSGNIN